MATLNLTKSQFADVAMIWLLDQVVNDERIDNEQFAKFINDHKSKLKAPLLNYFLNTDPTRRLDYRRISKVFSGDQAIQQIRIGPNESEKEQEKKDKKEGKIKKAVKTVLKKVFAKEELTLDDLKILKEVQDVYEQDAYEGED